MMGFSFTQRLRNKIRINRNNTVSLGANLKISGCTVMIEGENNHLEIGNNVRLRNIFIQIKGKGCAIRIGSGTVIGRNSYLSAREENISLTIGERCSLSRHAKLMTSDGHALYQDGIRINEAQDIVIEDRAWLADSVTVLKGVTVGHDAVIGIHAVVTKSIPPHAIAAGNPAKIVRQNVYKQRDASGRVVDPEILR